MPERTDGPTPRGGTYRIEVYTDDEMREVPEAEATQLVISEYSADDAWLGETVLTREEA